MAYAESTVGGTAGGAFRVFVQNIRHFDGGPAENYEHWNAEGGVNRISGSGGTIWSDGASYTLQLGLNGVASSGGFSYNYNTGTGRKNTWGTAGTNAYRNSAGVGYPFTSRFDVNFNNSPYLTSAWVQVGDTVQTKYRQADITNLSNDFYDTDNPWIDFSNPGGATCYAWFEFPGLSGSRFAQRNGVGSRHTWYLTEPERQAMRAVAVNSNAVTIRYVLESNIGGQNFYSFHDRTFRIADANPTFTDFDYVDTNATTVAVTGNDQVLIQGKSTLAATVAVADRAIATKQANMSSYTFSIGAYSQGAAWSNVADVVQNIGTVSVTGTQNLAVRAIDSRGNSTTVTKSVTVLPYASPGYHQALSVKYANDFDDASGLTVDLFNNVAIAGTAPMNLNGVNKNTVNNTTGVQYDISKGNDTSYSGVWKNVASTYQSNGNVNVTKAALEADILSKMQALGVDNSVRWYLKFRVTDALSSSLFTTVIDIGRPIFRIGSDNVLYYREYPITHPAVYTNTTLSSLTPDAALYGTFKFTALASGLTLNAPTNPFDGKRIMFAFKDNGTSRALTWNSVYAAVGATLPASTVAGKWMYVGCVYNETAAKWHVVAVNIEA